MRVYTVSCQHARSSSPESEEVNDNIGGKTSPRVKDQEETPCVWPGEEAAGLSRGPRPAQALTFPRTPAGPSFPRGILLSVLSVSCHGRGHLCLPADARRTPEWG